MKISQGLCDILPAASAPMRVDMLLNDETMGTHSACGNRVTGKRARTEVHDVTTSKMSRGVFFSGMLRTTSQLKSFDSREYTKEHDGPNPVSHLVANLVKAIHDGQVDCPRAMLSFLGDRLDRTYGVVTKECKRYVVCQMIARLENTTERLETEGIEGLLPHHISFEFELKKILLDIRRVLHYYLTTLEGD